MALGWPESEWLLLDANERRTACLEQVVGELGLQDRVAVRRDRAEVASREPELRHGFDLVVARGFGPPAVTAECAAGFLQVNGLLLVSEPPESESARWPAPELRSLGLTDEGASGAVRCLRQVNLAPAEVPRRVGVPAKQPRW